jgi:chromatin licensing and DNA replication factor 1
VYPAAYTFEQRKDKVKYQLIVDIPVSTVEGSDVAPTSRHLSAPPSLLVARRKIFRQRLIDTVKRHHQDFLISQGIDVQGNEIKRWHPKFDLSQVPDIEESPLPLPPLKNPKGFMTASDVLEDIRDKLAPKVVIALETVSKSRTSQSAKSNQDQTVTVSSVKSETQSAGLEGLVERVLTYL